MNDLERRVREGFDKVELPPEVRTRTLAAIAQLAEPEQYLAPATVPAAAPASASPTASGSVAVAARRAGRIVRWRRAVAALAACLALAAVGLTGSKLYFEETAYVGIDVNPSLELGINRFDFVVSATALNADGAALLEGVAVANKPYDEAVAELTSSPAFAPYMEQDAFVEISVTANDGRQSDALRAQSDARLRELPCEGSCHAVDEDSRRAAAAVGMGVGRYETALELLELDDTLTLDECASMSMRELRDRIAALEGEEEGSAPRRGHHGAGAGGGEGGAHGQGRAGEGKGRHAE